MCGPTYLTSGGSPEAVPPTRKAPVFTLLLTSVLAAPSLLGVGATPDVVINEVDADQTSTDSVEYFELFGPAGTSLDGVFAVHYNGNSTGDEEYRTVDLSGQVIPGDGFFVVGVATVANVDLIPANYPATNAIQNGADAIALWYDASLTLTEADFDGTTPATAPAGAVLIDAVLYGTSDAEDTDLLNALGLTGNQVDENANGNKDTESIGRCPDGGSALDLTSYATAAPTPGAANDCGPASAWSDQGNGLAGTLGEPLLTGTGDLSPGSANQVDLTNAAASALCALFLATESNPIPFKGGTLMPVPFSPPIFLNTSASGDLSLPFVWPTGIPAGLEVWAQFGIQDAGGPVGVALSNALLGITS